MRGKLDFADLLISARKLLHHDDARRYFQSKYQRLFIDEFQDTDPLQAEILLLLSANDPARARLGTRRAGPAVPGRRSQAIHLSLSPRRCGAVSPDLQSTAGLRRSFRHALGKPPFDRARFRSLSTPRLRRCRDTFRSPRDAQAHPGQPAVIALPMPKPYGTRNITKKAINACAPETVAAFIEWLLAQKWRVSDREDPACTREITPSDICILFRRFTNYGVDLTAEYVRCLEARGIRHVLVGSKSFHRREEVVAIRTALRAIEWPDDELSVFATIRGSLFSVQDGTLLKFRTQHGSLHPFKELPEDLDAEFAPIKDALQPARRTASPEELPAHCRHHQSAAGALPRARRLCLPRGRRTRAGQRPAARPTFRASSRERPPRHSVRSSNSWKIRKPRASHPIRRCSNRKATACS